MKLSRRDFGFPLAGVDAGSSLLADERARVPSDVFVFEDLPVRHAGSLDFREVLKGRTVDDCGFAVHESWLPGHSAPHPPHRHPGEEMFFMIDGALEVTINGTPSRITRGSVAFIGSGDLHGVRNPDETPAKYFVVELGPQK